MIKNPANQANPTNQANQANPTNPGNQANPLHSAGLEKPARLKMLKGMIVFLIALGMLINICPVEAANDTIVIIVNGKTLRPDVDPIVVEGRTLVPLRAIAEALGCSIEWSVQTQTATITGLTDIIKFRINSYYILKTSIFDDVEEEEIEIDVPPMVIKGRTMAPLRAVSESLNATVQWVQATNTVIIKTDYEWDELKEFSEDLATVRKGEKYGVVNKHGVLVVPFIYDKILPFSDGLAEVEKDGTKFFIDGNNNQYVLRSDKKQ